MKKGRLYYRTLTGALMTALLAMLGFSSCRSHKSSRPVQEQPVEREPEIRLMYGTPASVFRTIDSIPADTASTAPPSKSSSKTKI